MGQKIIAVRATSNKVIGRSSSDGVCCSSCSGLVSSFSPDEDPSSSPLNRRLKSGGSFSVISSEFDPIVVVLMAKLESSSFTSCISSFSLDCSDSEGRKSRR